MSSLQQQKLSWVHDAEHVDWQTLSALYARAGMGNKAPELLQTAFSNSRYVVFLYQDEELIGAGRVVADGCYCAIICDVAICPNRQNQGLGKTVMQHFLTQLNGHKRVILFSRPGKEAFYSKLGFSQADNFMVIYQ